MTTRGWIVALALGCLPLMSLPVHAGPCDGPAEATKVTLLGDWLPWASQGLFIAAELEGYYKEEGLEVELISPANPTDTIKPLGTQKVEFSLTYLPDVMQAREQGIPVISIAALLRPLPSGLVIPGDSEIKSAKDLKGKILAVNSIPSALAEMRTLLSSAGLTEKDVKVIDPGFGGITLLLEGKVDALFGLSIADPYILDPIYKEQGRPPIRFFQYTDYGVPNNYFMVIAANEDWTKAHPNATCRFLRASSRGLDTWLADPEPIIQEILRRNELYTHQQQTDIAEGTRASWKKADGTVFAQDRAVWEKARDWAFEHKLITKKPDPSTYFSNAFLPPS